MSFEDRVKKVMGSILGVDPGTIQQDSSKDTIADWDSLKQMNLILALEEEFGVTIPDEEAAHLTSYQLIHLVMSELTGEKRL